MREVAEFERNSRKSVDQVFQTKYAARAWSTGRRNPTYIALITLAQITGVWQSRSRADHNDGGFTKKSVAVYRETH
jgi:hypothetical protein